ncbi:MAG: hypothetical protein JSV98_04245 [candidate division WOR-3 bacterium]|nr:MAG: hypothetical protein JSV98_04245 [candidate division WOR-3 bacterium]
MMYRMKFLLDGLKVCCGITVIFLCLAPLHAMDTPHIKGTLRIPDSLHVQILKTSDGSTFIGRITEIKEYVVVFESDIGEIDIAILKIKEITEVPVTYMKEGAYWFPNPNDTRLFFAPTARNLKAGSGYFADYMLFFPMVAYGVTDNITIAGGMSLIPGLAIPDQLFYFTPKVGFEMQKVSLATGILMAGLPGEDEPLIGILYGVTTLGNADNNATAGVGYGFVDWDFADKPFLILGGQYRMTRRVSLVSENWILPGVDEPILSGGFRFFGEALSVDLALVIPVGVGGEWPVIPYIDFVVKF